MIANRYALGELVGSGGMADVYRATDGVLGREVAIKMLRATTTDDTARVRFDSEARTLASLNHPGLVTVLDAGVHEDRPFLVMELIDGPTLAERLRTAGPLDAAQLDVLGVQLAQALGYAHANGVIHRDVKPSNILLCADGRAVVTDFGIARLVSDASAHTQTGDVIGSPAYLSPEQVNGSAPTTAVDVYALGLVLLESATNVRAYPGTPMEAALARLTTPPPIPDTLDAGLADLIARMTALAPEDRPTALEVAAALGAPAVEDPTATAVLQLPLVEDEPRRPYAAILVAAAVVVALAVAGLAQLGSDPVEASSPSDTPTTSAPSATPTPTQRATVAPVVKATPKPQATAPAKAPVKKKAPAKGKG
ncbi:MAG: serine/threonine protein kinase, partial [Microbacterium sp.]